MMLTRSPFDCNFYGIEVGRLTLDATDQDIDMALVRGRAAGYDVLFLTVSERETHVLRLLGDLGLEPLETLVTSTLVSPVVSGVATAVCVEESEQADSRDLEVISAIAAEAITRSHLHADLRLPAAHTRALYAAWARNDASGRAQRIFVARAAGILLGYLTVVVTESRAMIDLVAVRATSRGQGVGSALLTRFIAWHATTGLTATVGTQASNPALALYRRSGFEPSHVDLSYHLWLDD